MISVRFRGKPFDITVIHVYASTTDAEAAEADQFYQDSEDLLELTPKKDVLFIIEDLNANAGSQEIPGVTGKFGLGTQNEAEQRITEFWQDNALVIANTLFNNTRDDFTHEHHHMVNTEIKLITFFVAENDEAVHSQQKQDLEMTVAQILSSS